MAVPETRVQIHLRIMSMLVDHASMTMIAMLFAIPQFIEISLTISGQINQQTDEIPGNLFSGFTMYIALMGYAMYFCKDCIHGRSIGKRAFQMQVIDRATREPLDPVKSVVRNLFCVLWPLEFMITFFSPARRMGDYVMNSEVIPYDPGIEAPPLNGMQLTLAVLLATGVMYSFWKFLMEPCIPGM